MLRETLSIFPAEILELVFQGLPMSSIPVVLRVNSTFHEVGLRVLYRVIPELPPRACIGCLKTLATHPTAAKYVREFVLDLRCNHVVGNLLRLLHQVLRKLTAVTHLNIEFSPHDNIQGLAAVFADCTFSLTHFSTSVRCDDALARFLASQPRIVDLCLRGFQTMAPFVLPAEALPRLCTFRSVHAGSPVLSQVLTGRPVECVSLSLFAGEGCAPLDCLMLSRCPIRRLTIMALDSMSPSVLFPEVASRFPLLQALHVVMLQAKYTQGVLQRTSECLAQFRELRYLTFMAPCMDVPLASSGSSLDQEHEIATLWHKACASLKTIILPMGVLWIERDGKWTSLAMS